MIQKLAARARVYSRGRGRKTHKDDAAWAGLATLFGIGVTGFAPCPLPAPVLR